MKLRHTQARKARTFNPRAYQNNGYYAMSVFWRRVNGCYGNDSKEFCQASIIQTKKISYEIH